MKLTNKQMDKLIEIDGILRNKYPDFKGFNGSRDKMQVVGIDEAIVEQELVDMDIDAIEKVVTPSIREKFAELEARVEVLEAK